MKIALVHDHLIQWGGAENVLLSLHEIWPRAPIFTLLYDEKQMGKLFPKEIVQPSYLQKLPFSLSRYQWYLPLMPSATESYKLLDFDVVLTSSSAFAKGVITHADTLNICYCHTPTRYLWSDTLPYIEGLRCPGLIKKILPYYLSRLRLWDQIAAQRVDYFIANSHFVRGRIQRYYKRESVVIYPPVKTENFYISPGPYHYYLTGGRIVPYKKFDLTIKAFNQLGIALKIFGKGPHLPYLKSIARKNIEFLGMVDEKTLADLYSKCAAFIHPQVEDFGITAIETMASGRPVIAYKEGGSLDTVIPGLSGVFFDEQEWEALADTIIRFEPERYDPIKIKEYAEKFNEKRFKEEILRLVNSLKH